MKLCRILIEPQSGIGTPLKGDTIFGHFCWQVAYDSSIVDGGIERLIQLYDNSPAVIFSSAYPFVNNSEKPYALKRPDMPLHMIYQTSKENRVNGLRKLKELKKNNWMLVDEKLQIKLNDLDLVDDKTLTKRLSEVSDLSGKGHWINSWSTTLLNIDQSHNSINRLTGTTGGPPFAPFTLDVAYHLPGTWMVVFALIDDSVTGIENITEAISRIGCFGFGKDSSTGQGRFSVVDSREINCPSFEAAHAIYCLSPCVPEKGSFSDVYYKPFVRFGRHGDRFATSSNPFKNPVLMADEGAIFSPKNIRTFSQPYFGRSVTDESKVIKNSITQGYSICLPVMMEQ